MWKAVRTIEIKGNQMVLKINNKIKEYLNIFNIN